MLVKWIKEKPAGWGVKLTINLIGALTSLIVLLVFFVTKFLQVWPVLIFLPAILLGFQRIKRHYLMVGEQLRIQETSKRMEVLGNVIIVPVAGITQVVENSLNYAKSLNVDQIIAVHVSFDRDEERLFVDKWRAWQPEVRLVALHSSYRSIIYPLTKFIDTVEKKASEMDYNVTVLIPQFIPKKSWQNILHNQSSLLIRAYLLYRRDLIVTTVPYHLRK